MKLQTGHPLEVKGTMSPKGADRVGMLIALSTVVDKLLWKAIIFVGLVLSGVYTYRVCLSWGAVGGNQLEISHICSDSYHFLDQSAELKHLIQKRKKIALE